MRQLFTRAAVIALTAGTLAACETAGPAYGTGPGGSSGARQGMTPNFPIVQAPPAVRQAPESTPAPTASTPAAQAPIESEPPPPPARLAAPVESQPLAPLSPAPPPAPAPTTVVTSITGPVVEIAGRPVTYVVKRGDNIDAIARRLGVTRAELAKANDLESPYRIQPGQELTGPAAKGGKAYVVQSGDTLFAIARRFSVTAEAVAEENDLTLGSTLRRGQRLRLPTGFRDRGPTRTTVAAPRGAVETAPAYAAPVPSRPAPPPPRDEAPVPGPVTTTVTTVTGPVVEIAGKPKIHTVRKGDAIDSIARELGTTRKQLAEANDLSPPYRINPGDRLKGPATPAKAYVVQSGDTLTAVAKRFGISVSALAGENGLRTGAAVKKGQKLTLPAGFRDKGPIKTTTTVRPPAAVAAPPPVASRPPAPIADTPAYTPSAPVPYTPSRPIQAPTPTYPRTPSAPVAAQPAPGRTIIDTGAAPTEAEITAAARGRFVWPLRGEVLSGFGPKGAGQRNDGLNIQAAEGAPIRAAAAGEVVYAGNQVPGFGNLVLIKHADGWVTAYAHLASADVKMRQMVAQGQQIGEVGSTGGVNEPQLHFEVRYAPSVKDKAKPVDPGLVLPR